MGNNHSLGKGNYMKLITVDFINRRVISVEEVSPESVNSPENVNDWVLRLGDNPNIIIDIPYDVFMTLRLNETIDCVGVLTAKGQEFYNSLKKSG
jgi:hypothetical protein